MKRWLVKNPTGKFVLDFDHLQDAASYKHLCNLTQPGHYIQERPSFQPMAQAILSLGPL